MTAFNNRSENLFEVERGDKRTEGSGRPEVDWIFRPKRNGEDAAQDKRGESEGQWIE